MIKGVLLRIVANPYVYNTVQFLVGARYVRRHFHAQVAPAHSAAFVLDVGGGTGINRGLWPATCTYVCLDTDPVKLSGFLRAYPDDLAVRGDATRVPIKTSSVDAVVCSAVSHHIPDDLLPSLITESIRSLKPGGRFIFFDAVWEPSRWTGRLLWKYDRGSYPRTKGSLKTLIGSHCTIIHWQEINIFHKYILCTGTKIGIVSDSAGGIDSV